MMPQLKQKDGLLFMRTRLCVKQSLTPWNRSRSSARSFRLKQLAQFLRFRDG